MTNMYFDSNNILLLKLGIVPGNISVRNMF